MALRRTASAIVCLALAMAPVMTLGGCKIVADRDLAADKAKPGGNFDATRYVDGIWASKVVPDFQARAVDLDTLLAAIAQDPDKAGRTYGQRAGEGNPWSYEVKGSGKVASLDTSSRHGVMTLDVPTKAGTRKVIIQIGPVVFGTDIRDSLPFVHFGDFVNQIQFAQVSRAFNDRASREVRTSFDPKTIVGKTVTFSGATTVTDPSGALTVTPVILKVSTGGGS